MVYVNKSIVCIFQHYAMRIEGFENFFGFKGFIIGKITLLLKAMFSSVRITRADQTFKTIDVPGFCYYKALRSKLGWNGRFES